MKKLKSMMFLSIVMSGLIGFSSTIPAFAECNSKEIREKVLVGYDCDTDDKGKQKCTPIFEERTVAVVTKCNDTILIQLSIQSDIAGNVYIDGEKVGVGGKVSNMKVSADVLGRLSGIGMTQEDFSNAVMSGKVTVADANSVITDDAKYQEAGGFKTAKTMNYDDWQKIWLV